MTRILIIEDEAPLRANIARLFIAEGFEIIEAADGAAGVELAIRELPDLIVCDIMMPELDGFGTLFSLRENVTTSHIPFIFLTASARDFDRKWSFELGADCYLTKPFRLDDLLAEVKKRLGK